MFIYVERAIAQYFTRRLSPSHGQVWNSERRLAWESTKKKLWGAEVKDKTEIVAESELYYRSGV